jgi:hypothetical protein
MDWTVFFTQEAEELLLRIEDRRIRKLLKERAMRLDSHPEMQGKPLGGDLAGLRSVRAVGHVTASSMSCSPKTMKCGLSPWAFAKPDSGRMSTRWPDS